MNLKKYIKNTAFAVAIIIGSSSTVFGANTYNDVPSNHFAYSSVIKMSDKGIIVGDGTSYYPNQIIDKMETARILARVAGYNTANGYTFTDKTKNTINLFKKSFPIKWGNINKDYENSIAYLYEKEILNIDDLNKFVTKYTDGTEKVRELTKEELAVFLVNTMGKKSEAVNYKTTNKFADDSAISETAKSYVYYLKDKGVITADSNNKFNPTSSVTKAEMAVFLDKAIYSKEETTPPNNSTNNTTNNNTNGNSQTLNVTTDEGKLASIYPSSNVVSITNLDNQLKVYKLSSNVKLYIDGVLSTIDKLSKDMSVFLVIINNEATEIRTQKLSSSDSGQTDNSNSNNNNNNSSNNSNNNNNNNGNNSNNNNNIDSSQLLTRVCTVTSTGSVNNSNSISVLVQMLSPSGDIYKETQTYILASNCTIKKSDKDISFSSIAKEDIVTIKVFGNMVYSILVEEKNMTLKDVELIDKRLNNENIPILTVKTKDGVKYELKVTSSSDMKRKGQGTVKWKELKIGDILEIDKEYNNITYLYAVGTSSTIEGTVEEIVISNYSNITLKDKYGEKIQYRVDSPLDLYSIKLGSKIRLILDSKEIDSIRILSEPETNLTIKGNVDILRYNYMYVDTDNLSSIKVLFDNKTTVYDAVLNKTVTLDDIKENMYVTVTFTNSSDNIAKSITIVSK